MNLAGPPLLSPDGSKLLIPTESEDRRTTLWVRPLDSIEARKLEGTDGASYPFWSPDSQQIAFFTDGKLSRVAASGGAVLPVCEARSGRGGAWSAAGGGMGTIIFAPSNQEPLFQVPAARGTPKQVTKFDPTRRERGHRFPIFLPDGRNFLYLSLTLGEGGLPVVHGSLDGGASRPITTSDSRFYYSAPTEGQAHGYLLFVRGDILLAQPFESRSVALAGDPVPIKSGVGVTALRQMPGFSASESGTLAFRIGVGTRRGQLGWISRSGAIQKMFPGLVTSLFLRLSSDGKMAAYARATGVNSDIMDRRLGA
jgi:hypothetical protein